MDFNLAGRTAMVTGGSKGIGLAVVRRLAARSGAIVMTSSALSLDCPPSLGRAR
jgi:NAD(P)-dependent dehydrogenase (short-subunit alcohol dehydrogenase family)